MRRVMARFAPAVPALALVLPPAAPAGAQDADRFAKVEIKVTPVAGSVYMLEGAGGNIAVSVGEDGVVIVDDQFAPLVDKIRAALRGVTGKPVRFVLNTHYHGDHTGGNALLQKDARVTVLLAGPLPAKERAHPWRRKFEKVHALLAAMDDGSRVRYTPLALGMLAADGGLGPGLFQADGVHLSGRGYRVWAGLLAAAVRRLLE